MKIRIDICDDETQDAKYLSDICTRWALDRHIEIESAVFPSAEAFLFFSCEDMRTDILLLDVEMPGMDGVTLAKRLRAMGSRLQIVFVTGYPDYIADGYDVSALHYLIKPVCEEKLREVLSRAMENLIREKASVLIYPDGMTVRLYEEEIAYFEAFAHTTVLYTEKEQFRLSESIGELEGRLSAAFIRCHRSYLVNLQRVSRVMKNEILLDGGMTVPLARRQYGAICAAFLAWHLRREGK